MPLVAAALGIALAASAQGQDRTLDARRAISRLDVTALHRFMVRPEGAELTQEEKDDLLSWAASGNQDRPQLADWKAIVDELLDHGARLNTPRRAWLQPLMVASVKWSDRYIPYLLQKGANPDPPDAPPGGSTPLYEAIGSQDADYRISRFIDQGPTEPRARWHRTVLALLKGGADPNAPGMYSKIPFQRVCYWGENLLVAQMLAHGADLSQVGPTAYQSPGGGGYTALHCAALRDSTANAITVRLLLAFGADPNVKDALGRTPLDIALFKRHVLVAAAFGFTDWPPPPRGATLGRSV